MFPSNPVEGQFHTIGTVTYQFTNGAWEVYSGTPPVIPPTNGGGGVPVGGIPGQHLTKRTVTDFDTYWTTPLDDGLF
jgi:hypothetical protein